MSTIRAMTNNELGVFLPRIGDIYKVKEYASSHIGKKKSTETFALKLKNKLQLMDTTGNTSNQNGRAGSSSSLQSPSTPKNLKVTRKVNFNWICDNKQVRTSDGGGVRETDVPRSCKKKEILKIALDLYFPNGVSKCKGPLSDHIYDIRDYANLDFDENITVGEIYNITRMTRIRFCLNSTSTKFDGEKKKKLKKRRKTAKSKTSESSQSESDFESVTKPKQKPVKKKGKYVLSSSESDSACHNEKNVKSAESFPAKVQTSMRTEVEELPESIDLACDFNIEEFLKLARVVTIEQNIHDADVAKNVENIIPEIADQDPIMTDPFSNDSVSVENTDSLNLNTTLLRIQRQISNSPEVVLINAWREGAVSSIANAMKRSSFSVLKRLDVAFVDVDEVAEGAADDGGPTRELFRIALGELKDSSIFGGK